MVDVDPQMYFRSSSSMRFSGQSVVGALDNLKNSLAGSGGMAGSDTTGQEFSADYDPAANDIAAGLAGLIDMSTNAADLIRASGLNHQAAQRASTEGAPPPPSVPLPNNPTTAAPSIPSAYGGGGSEPTGAIGTAWHYIQKWVGYVWPNGSPEKLEAAAQAWTTAYNTIHSGDTSIDWAKNDLAAQQSPEIPAATAHLDDLKGKYDSLSGACLQMATSCNNLAQAIRDAHNELISELEEFAAEFVVGEIIFGALIEIGGEIWGNAAMALRAMNIARRCAKIIEKLIELARAAAKVAKAAGDKIKGLVSKIKKIVAGIAKRSPKGSKLDPDDLLAVADYTGDGYRDLNAALRSGTLDASQQARVDAINNALAKLPKYEGPVTRGTDLPPSVLSKYEPGKTVVEDAFTSTTKDPTAAFPGNTSFEIVSKSGRSVGDLSLFPNEAEVLFPPGTQFTVLSKVFDPATGRTIIRMVER